MFICMCMCVCVCVDVFACVSRSDISITRQKLHMKTTSEPGVEHQHSSSFCNDRQVLLHIILDSLLECIDELQAPIVQLCKSTSHTFCIPRSTQSGQGLLPAWACCGFSIVIRSGQTRRAVSITVHGRAVLCCRSFDVCSDFTSVQRQTCPLGDLSLLNTHCLSITMQWEEAV